MPGASRVLLLPVVLAVLGSAAPAAWGAWPSDPSVNVPLCNAVNRQVNPGIPVIVSDGASGAIVTWDDYRSGIGNARIYAQRVTAAGVPAWTTDGVAMCAAANNQSAPAAVSDGAGGAIVAWQDYRGGATADIYAQRVNAAGVPQWTAEGIAICAAADDQKLPAIVSDGAGGAIVTWQDFRDGGTGDIYAQRVNASGVPQWTADGIALCAAANNQSSPTIASDGAGGAIVTWSDYRSGNYDIYAQRANAAGVPQWTADGVALCACANEQNSPRIVSDGAGGAIVTWQDYRSGIAYDSHVYAQRVNAAGMREWPAEGVAICAVAGGQLGPNIAYDGAGGAIITWQDHRNPRIADIYAQRVNEAGIPQWTADGVLCGSLDDLLILTTENPMIVSDGAGGAIVTWFAWRGSGNYDIHAQRMSAAGLPQWAGNGVTLCDAARNQNSPRILSDGAGGAIVAWRDFRSGTQYDIYAQNVNADGTLGGTIRPVSPPPAASSLAIRGIEPNPSDGVLRVSFSLLDHRPSTLELFDIGGRRMESVSLGSPGPGAHATTVVPRRSLPPGIYRLTLTQGNHRAFGKVAIVR